MRRGRRRWQDPQVVLPDEGETPMMFLLKDGTELMGYFDPERQSFVTRDINRLESGVYPEVNGWRPILADATGYIAATMSRRAIGETRNPEGDGEEAAGVPAARQDPFMALKLGESVHKRRRRR